MLKRRILNSAILSVIFLMVITSSVLAAIGDVTNFTVIPQDTTANLAWTKASASTHTMVRMLTTGYPTSATGVDGSTQVYFGTSYYYKQTGLTSGTTYYYSAWGYDGVGYSVTPAHSVATTSASDTVATLTTPTLPSNFNQNPDSSSWFDNLQPITGSLAAFIADWGMPRDNGMMAIGVLVVVALAVGVFVKVKNIFIAYMIMFAGDIALVSLDLMFWWSIPIMIAIGLGIWGLERSYQ